MIQRVLFAAVIGLFALGQSALADHKRHVSPKRHPNHAACERSGWNHPSCAHLGHYGDSTHYYYHHDRRRLHGLALD
ncbi:MAG: hypothetical protein AB7U61_00170 [Methylocystis sp.]